MSVPNQKIIYIERSSENVKKNYLKVSNTNLYEALYNLKPNAFKLWIYFLDNANGYQLELYPEEFRRITGVADSTYREAFKELQRKGYLTQSKKQKNFYLFKEVSDIAEKPDLIYSLDSEDFNAVKKDLFDENQ